jgi:hypothetical protein
MRHLKIVSVAITIIAAVIIVPAAIAGSSAPIADSARVPTSGPNAINPANCKFLHREIDVVTDLGTLEQKLAENGRYDIAEDARHDAKMNCLTNLVNTLKKRIVQPAAPVSLHYMRVLASGTGATVTAGCPSKFRVVGGGSQSEVEGSYPSTNQTWTVTRDHLSPRHVTVYAVCIRVGS